MNMSVVLMSYSMSIHVFTFYLYLSVTCIQIVQSLTPQRQGIDVNVIKKVIPALSIALVTHSLLQESFYSALFDLLLLLFFCLIDQRTKTTSACKKNW